jgi:RNA polymerase sigma-70 factor, ECF subfamily
MLRKMTKFTDAELASFPIKVSNILTARFCNYNSYDDIAARLNLPIGTIKSRIHRARARVAAMRQEVAK